MDFFHNKIPILLYFFNFLLFFFFFVFNIWWIVSLHWKKLHNYRT